MTGMRLMKRTAMRNGRSLVAGILVSGMLFSFFPMLKIRAAGAIGKVTVNGVAKEYTSLGDLVDAVDDYDDKTIIIDMYCDWNSNTRLCIPSDSKTTLNMHGHKYDRGLTSDKHNGEVIWIGSDAVVTINGSSNSSERNNTHDVKYYYSASRSSKAGGSRSFNGGVITGGYSSNGAGGIDIKSNVTLILNDVTIAGCRAEQSLGTDGYGGGIWVHGGTGEAGTIIMNNSTIFGCYAYNDGGGLYQSNHNNFILEMNESHIDSNYCYNQGAGIDVDGETVMILGDGKSTVSDNHTNGGSGDDVIYINNGDHGSVSNLTINGNDGNDIYITNAYGQSNYDTIVASEGKDVIKLTAYTGATAQKSGDDLVIIYNHKDVNYESSHTSSLTLKDYYKGGFENFSVQLYSDNYGRNLTNKFSVAEFINYANDGTDFYVTNGTDGDDRIKSANEINGKGGNDFIFGIGLQTNPVLKYINNRSNLLRFS